MPAWPVKMSESQVPVRSAPLLGQHTEEVLSEWLGLNGSTLPAVAAPLARAEDWLYESPNDPFDRQEAL